MAGEHCRTACATRNHDSWGECARAAHIQIDRHSLTQTGKELDKRKDHTLARYRDLRKAGVQPKAPTKSAVDAAEAAVS